MAKKDATSTARYHRLTKAGEDFIDLQFQAPESKVPWKAILLAIFLFVVGSLLIVVAALIMTNYISVMNSDSIWPLIILGFLMFIPGFYHVRIAYYAYRRYPGYSFDDIPDFN